MTSQGFINVFFLIFFHHVLCTIGSFIVKVLFFLLSFLHQHIVVTKTQKVQKFFCRDLWSFLVNLETRGAFFLTPMFANWGLAYILVIWLFLHFKEESELRSRRADRFSGRSEQTCPPGNLFLFLKKIVKQLQKK